VELLGGRRVELPASKGSGLGEFEVAVFTASCDAPEVNKEFAKALKLDYPILSDPGKKTAAAYGVVDASRPLPQRWTFFIGKDGKILAIDKEVNAANHGAAIAERLTKLGVPKKKPQEKPEIKTDAS